MRNEAPSNKRNSAEGGKAYTTEQYAEHRLNVPVVKCNSIQATLLSKHEYDEYKNIIPHLPAYWWLRSPGERSNDAACVYSHGTTHIDGVHADSKAVGVRPAFFVSISEGSEFKAEDKLKLPYVDYDCTVLNVSDNGRMLYVLADDFISYHIFDKETNDWEKSSLKDWLNDYKEQVFDKESHYYFEPERRLRFGIAAL